MRASVSGTKVVTFGRGIVLGFLCPMMEMLCILCGAGPVYSSAKLLEGGVCVLPKFLLSQLKRI